LPDDLVDMEKGDRFTLECGHEGRIIWVSPDKKVFGVRGSNRSCRFCGKKTSGGWVPTVYMISIDEMEENE
jgi:hypothetical protein